MLSTDYNEKILGLQDVIIKNIEEKEQKLTISIEIKRKSQICPVCKRETKQIHDYRIQRVQDMPLAGRNVTLILRKRRYVCDCGKRFYEENSFLPRYHRRTQRKSLEIIKKLMEARSYTSVAIESGVSTGTVIRLFNNISYEKPRELPEVLGIDEFKGNSGNQKYHCILTDIKNHRVIDILHTRNKNDLIDYIKQYDRSEVKYFVSDMYGTYGDIANTYFRKAVYVIDKYHWIRQLTCAVEAVRKDIQKRFSKSYRLYFKHSKALLLKRNSLLSDEEKQQVQVMLSVSANLSTAYFLKEELYKLIDCKDKSKHERMLRNWISDALDSGITSFEKCGKTYNTWFRPIINSLSCTYTNGFTEGCNNKIKVLKRTAYGFQNFKRYRNRILFVFSGGTRDA